MKFSVLMLTILLAFSCGKKFTLATQEDVEDSKPATICENETLAIVVKPSSTYVGWDNKEVKVSRTVSVTSNAQYSPSIEAKIQARNKDREFNSFYASAFQEGGYGISLSQDVAALCANARYAAIKNAYMERDAKTDKTTKMVEFWSCHGPCAVK